MPSRIIREGILTSEKINTLSWDAELFYRRLMSVADDFGRYFAHPSLLRAACYPLQVDKVSEKMISKWVAECVSAGVITAYGNGKFLLVHEFRQQTRGKSKFPEPDLQVSENNLLSKNTTEINPKITDLDSGPTTTSNTSSTTTTTSEPALKDLPESLRTQRVVAKWQQWMTVRRGFKKPANWAHLFNEQSEWLGQFTESEAFEIISQSIRNGWQGLFEPKNKPAKHQPESNQRHEEIKARRI